MKIRYLIILVILIFIIVLAYLLIIGPNQNLQTGNAIEPKVTTYLKSNKFLNDNEQVLAYKSLGFYSLNKGAVITDSRVFIYDDNHAQSIALNKISMVVIRNTHLGHQEVLITSHKDGAIGFEVYHSNIPAVIALLKVTESMIKDNTRITAAETL